jgi:hypothetical protein
MPIGDYWRLLNAHWRIAHWRLFFDPLLVSLAANFPGYKTNVESKHPIPSQVQKIETSMVSSSL